MTSQKFGLELSKEMADAARIVALEEQVKWLDRRVDDLTDRLAASEHQNFMTRMSIIMVAFGVFVVAVVLL